MHPTSHLRHATALVAVLGIALSGCASVPTGAPVGLNGPQQTAKKFNTGRVALTVTDYGGMPLRQARVDVESAADQEDYFRTAAFSDVWGRVSFAGLPEKVRITIYHAETNSNYSREFHVPPSGTTDLRMMVQPFQ